MKNITKLQIETVEKLLNDTLETKKKELAEANFAKDIAKYETPLKNFNKKALELRTMAERLKKEVELNPKLEVELDQYGSFTVKLPKDLQDSYDHNIIKAKGAGYCSHIGDYKVNLKKEEKAVADYILGLKLGTALMADMQTLLDMIAKIK